MTKKPIVSIIIVTCDRPELLQRAIDSVFAQTYRPIELVLIDNQSASPVRRPTATPEGISVTLTRTPRFMNASQSRNFGVDHATGDYVSFLDDDDYYLPIKVEKQTAALEGDPDAAFSYMDAERHEMGGKVSLMTFPAPDDLERLMLYRPIHTNSLMLRREIMNAERFNEKLDMYTDLHVTFRLFEKYKPAPVMEIGSVWKCDNRGDQLTHQSRKRKFDRINKLYRNWKIICDDFAHLIDRSKPLRAAYYRKQCALSLLSLRLIEAAHYALAWGGLRDNHRSGHRPETKASRK